MQIIRDCNENKEESVWVQLFLPDDDVSADNDDNVPSNAEENQEVSATNDHISKNETQGRVLRDRTKLFDYTKEVILGASLGTKSGKGKGKGKRGRDRYTLYAGCTDTSLNLGKMEEEDRGEIIQFFRRPNITAENVVQELAAFAAEHKNKRRKKKSKTSVGFAE